MKRIYLRREVHDEERLALNAAPTVFESTPLILSDIAIKSK